MDLLPAPSRLFQSVSPVSDQNMMLYLRSRLPTFSSNSDLRHRLDSTPIPKDTQHRSQDMFRSSNDDYLLPQDQAEGRRLEMQYATLKLATGGSCFSSDKLKAGLKPGVTIADVGCGTGIWLKDAVSELRTSGLFIEDAYGFDFTTSKFPIAAFGLKFLRQDLLDPFPEEFHSRFDIVNARLVLLWIRPEHRSIVLQNLYTILKPGGHLQTLEYMGPFPCIHPQGPLKKLADFIDWTHDNFEEEWDPSQGTMYNKVHEIPYHLALQKFTNIESRIVQAGDDLLHPDKAAVALQLKLRLQTFRNAGMRGNWGVKDDDHTAASLGLPSNREAFERLVDECDAYIFTHGPGVSLWLVISAKKADL